MADAPELEQDIQLQKSAEKLLAELQTALPPFLWKTTISGRRRTRRQVRVRDADSLVALLEPFQELPQLLDPHLNSLVPLLAQAFLDSVRAKRPAARVAHSQLLMPISRAICRLLYTFCKIRGEKVIVRFLSTETRHLELLLSAIEKGSEQDSALSTVTDTKEQLQDELAFEGKQVSSLWQWEERYITLLWLSQLLLAPFDLASISSSGTGADAPPAVEGLIWPANVPGVTLRVIPLAMKFLSSAGKERDAAKVLLVRIATRRDMQELGVLHVLINWATSCLRRPSSDAARSTYYHIGILSFLAGVLLSSSSTADMDQYLSLIFTVIQDISDAEDNTALKALNASAVARKTIIKVFRMISVLLLRRPSNMISAEMVELTIDHMLECLKDLATPVRLAASKGLSVITLKLPPDMAKQVVEAVLHALKQKVLRRKSDAASGQHLDLSAVDPLEWHGLILTLSHLLYRRSPPASSLPRILAALLTGLSFEQRSSSGSSIGTNVRDAANFGIWATARRYTTAELQAVDPIDDGGTEHPSALQILATALVVAASLDPAGNIRRGASAALQELIGRHPDTVAEGIQIVQVVDYHAVARRSRAVQEISLKAARLSRHYRDALLEACFEWRGVGDSDASARRVAAEAFGALVWTLMAPSRDWSSFCDIIARIESRALLIVKHQVTELHGLILCLSSMLRQLQLAFIENEFTSELSSPVGLKSAIRKCKTLIVFLLEQANRKWFTYRHQELTAEAVAQLLLMAYPVLEADAILTASGGISLLDSGVLSKVEAGHLNSFTRPNEADDEADGSVETLQFVYQNDSQLDQAVLDLMLDMLERRLLCRNEQEVVQPASSAALSHITILSNDQRAKIIESWNNSICGQRGGYGFIHAVFLVYPILPAAMQDEVQAAIGRRWTERSGDIETKRAVLSCLSITSVAEDFMSLIEEGIEDYTTNARGDVGSLLRIEAVKAAGIICKDSIYRTDDRLELFERLFGKVLRLAAEKLDKVRAEGQMAVVSVLDEAQAATLKRHSTSSIPYFSFLLIITTPTGPLKQQYDPQWRIDLLQGFVTSADTGSEELVRASRAALAEFCQKPANQSAMWADLTTLLKISTGNDRIIVPVMEVMGFLFDYGLVVKDFDLGSFYNLVQRAHYKTGNVRKLEVAVKLYGCLVVHGYMKAIEKLTSLLLHSMPLVRNQAADTLFSVTGGLGKSVNWATAKKADVEALKRALTAT